MSFDLATLPAWAFAFVLVLGRIGAALTLLPGLGEAAPPAMQPGMKGVATRSAGGAHDFVKDAQSLVRN